MWLAISLCLTRAADESRCSLHCNDSNEEESAACYILVAPRNGFSTTKLREHSPIRHTCSRDQACHRARSLQLVIQCPQI